MGEGPASALNNAIVQLMMMPLLIMGFVGFKWWKKEKEVIAAERGEKKQLREQVIEVTVPIML